MQKYSIRSAATLRACWPALLAALILLSGCRSLPRDFDPPEASYALEPAAHGPLADFAHRGLAGFSEDESGFLLVYNNEADLNWRLAMIDSAQETLDLQTYLWRADFGGGLLLSRMVAAADRGVRVRLLVDDFLLRGQDRFVAALNDHPNIEIRVWNPGGRRQLGRNLEFLVRLSELNHRLHNKVLIADNRMLLAGGRNISNEYYGISERFNFLDIDALAVGPVVPPASDMFDRYWNSDHAVSAAQFHRRGSVEDLPDMIEQRRARLQASALSEIFATEPRDWQDFLSRASTEVLPGKGEIIYDKVYELRPSQHAKFGLKEFFRQAEEEVLVASPYLVPGEVFFEEADSLGARDVEMSIMTNSLGSTNQTIVHAAYARTRVPMLEAGLDVYEMKYQPAIQPVLDTAPVQSSWVGLHAKCAVVDRRRVYIGSYNITPRSANLNTEMALLIDSEALGAELANVLDEAMAPENAWQLKLDEAGNLRWISADGKLVRQPNRNFLRSVQSGIFGLFPLEEHL